MAERVADALAARGHETTTVDAKAIGSDLDVGASDAVLVGASVHLGSHHRAVRRFVRANRDVLATKPTGFFQVSGSSADDEGAAEAARSVDEFSDATGWRRDRTASSAGPSASPCTGSSSVG